MQVAGVEAVADAIAERFCDLDSKRIKEVLDAATSGCGLSLVPTVQVAEVDAFADMFARVMMHGQGQVDSVLSVR